MNSSSTTKSYLGNEIKSVSRVFIWSIAWGLSIGPACIGIKWFGSSNNLAVVAVLAVNIGIGFGALFAHFNWLRALDELQRKIQLESMALTLGCLWIILGGFVILDLTGIMAIGYLHVALLLVLAAITTVVGNIFGMLRYR